VSGKIRIRRVNSKSFEEEQCTIIYPSNKSLVVVLFPSAENLKITRILANQDLTRPLLVINPQWRVQGQIVGTSDFSIHPWLHTAEEFLSSFEKTYVIFQKNILLRNKGLVLSKNKCLNICVIRVLRRYPENWAAYLLTIEGSSFYIGSSDWKPTNENLNQALRIVHKNPNHALLL